MSSQQNERSEPPKWNLLARFSRERHDLSTSVEETLLKEHEAIKQDLLDSLHTWSHPNVIAPQLTLRSGPMPVVDVGTTPQVAYDEEQKAVKEQNSGLFARIAQRFTGSPNDVQQKLASSEDALPERVKDVTPRLVTSSTDQQRIAEAGKASKEMHRTAAMNKQSGRLAKIRLETAPEPAIVLEKKDAINRIDQGDVAEMTFAGAGYQERANAATSDRHSQGLVFNVTANSGGSSFLLDNYSQEAYTGSIIPSTETVEEDASSSSKSRQGTLSGSGIVEAGQRDIFIEDQLITSTDVVFVTMTSNPGPAIVHYVTLVPSVGFTIHLSFPVTTKTSFNYVVLMGELF